MPRYTVALSGSFIFDQSIVLFAGLLRLIAPAAEEGTHAGEAALVVALFLFLFLFLSLVLLLAVAGFLGLFLGGCRAAPRVVGLEPVSRPGVRAVAGCRGRGWVRTGRSRDLADRQLQALWICGPRPLTTRAVMIAATTAMSPAYSTAICPSSPRRRIIRGREKARR
ncbi:hypothetical protein [Streptomyces chartreusis]|uniref:hypothetical protein n=1 Tax=Streptomyces chartreusis TaxID=1969 RepID=UPI0033BDE7E1